VILAGPRRVLRRVSREAWAAWGVFVLAFAVRAAWAAWVDSPFDTIFSDMGGYIHRAMQLAYGAAAYRPDEPHPNLTMYDPWSYLCPFYAPGGHFVYAAQMRLLGWTHHVPFTVVHCLWGAAVAPCALLLALRVVPRLSVAVVVGVAVAVWGPLLAFTSYFSSEQPDAALVALSAWLTVRLVEGKRAAIGLGLVTALAYLVRSQIILTMAVLGVAWLVGVALHRAWARPRFVPLFVAGLFVLAAVGFGAERYHRLSGGRWGIICDDEGMARLFADTGYARVKATTTGRDGHFEGTYYFEPPSKMISGDRDEYAFDGYIGDPALLAKGRREAVAKMTFGDRVGRWLSNVSLLFVRNDLWPEATRLGGQPARAVYAEVSKAVMAGLLAPLTLLGIAVALLRPTPVRVVCAAHVLTSLFTAAFFYGEMRYRIPYDVFYFLLALVAVAALAPRLARWLEPASPKG
jgi:hypothetical protein